MIKKLLKTTLLTITLTTTLLTPSHASNTDNWNGWYYSKDTQGWQYYNNGYRAHDGLVQVGEKQYYMDSLGNMRTGWIQYNDYWMYTNNDGSIVKADWKQINHKWYYFGNTGVMLTGEITLSDGKVYNLASDGHLIG